MKVAIEKNSKILAIFAIACTLIVGVIHQLTKDKIARQEQQQLLTSLHSIIAPERHNNDIYQDCIFYSEVDELNTSISAKLQTAYIAKMNGSPVAIAFTSTAPDGYNGNINMLVAINLDGSISGVRVLSHKETPGLGDKIEVRKSDWIKSFTDKTLTSETDSRWAVSKDGGMFDQFTGATITPRAVVKQVKRTALYFGKHHQALFQQTKSCRGDIQ